MISSLNESQQEIINLKKKFLLDRKKIESSFLKNNLGQRNCNENTKLIDNLIKQIFKIITLKNYGIEDSICTCAVGGYGREILAPFSDIDVLFIYDKSISEQDVEKTTQFILFPFWDLGFKVGYAVRNIEDTKLFAQKDHIIQTSMLDARFICGSKRIYEKTIKDFNNNISYSGVNLLKQKIKERKERVEKEILDYFKNEPNLKESAGSLRDINFIFWCVKILKLGRLQWMKEIREYLTKKEKRKINSAFSFLLSLRCHLHYQSGRANEKFTFDDQNEISKKIYKLEKIHSDIRTEKMMKIYFKETRNIKSLTEIFSQILEELIVKKKQPLRLQNEKFSETLKIFLKKVHLGKNTIERKRSVFENIERMNNEEVYKLENINLFKKIFFSLKKHRFLMLCDLGVTSKIIPEFRKIENLPQFDRFHSLTVGQHTLEALSLLKDLKKKERRKDNYKLFYRELQKEYNYRALFFAILLHDIGKGRGGNHQIKGSKIAKKILIRLHEKLNIVNETAWLINNHSLLSDYAFNKDLEDYSVIRSVSKKINNMTRLRTLYLLTVTDISAVDEGLWNNWKASLLGQLFLKIESQIKNPKKIQTLNERIANIKSNILKKSRLISRTKLESIARITYPNYWLLQSQEMITYQIEKFLLKKKFNDFSFKIEKASKNKFHDLVLVTKDRPKLFLDIISIFAVMNISIFEARIFTLDDGTVIDTFKFSLNENKYFTKTDISRAMYSLEDKLNSLKKQNKIKIKIKSNFKRKLVHNSVDVEIDNNTSSTYTILLVRTNNRPKLLYEISNILLKNRMVISMAKISTHGNFVEDSFHLRSQYGLKIENKKLLERITDEIKNQLGQMD